MRIAIDYRVLSTEAADRGMGRYTQQQLREVLKLDQENEYLVICYPNFRDSLMDPFVKKAKNVQFKYINEPEINNHILWLVHNDKLKFSAKLQNFLYQQQVDIYHATTPFITPTIPDFDVCPLISTLYDLIPLVFPRKYLDPPEHAEEYELQLHFTNSSQRLISISKSARQDAYHYLGYQLQDNRVAYPVVDPCFRVLSENERINLMKNIQSKFNLPSQFILSITGIHHSKNAETLLNAFARLSESLRRQMPLFFIFPSPHAEKEFQYKFGTHPNVFWTNSVSDSELVAVYNSATMVVHPSRYEGFGYPVAEAMKCGTPVITTTTSSLPEIGADAAILIEPENTTGFAEAMEMLYQDAKQREQMKINGLAAVEKFSVEQLGRVTYETYKSVM